MMSKIIKRLARRRRMAALAMPPPNRYQFFRDATTAHRLNPTVRALFIKDLCEARAFHEVKNHYAKFGPTIESHFKVHELKEDLQSWCVGMNLVDGSKCTRAVATDEERMRDALLEIDKTIKWCKDTNYGTSREYLIQSLTAAQTAIDNVRDTFWPRAGE